MAMYLTVRQAAERLGVSSVTIRRWTASGILPCTRTPGGHRRISVADIDDLARLLVEGDLVGARLAREREIDTLIAIAVAITSRLELDDLLKEIARQMTSIFDCTYCTMFEYDWPGDALRLLAEYDRHGSHVSPSGEPGSVLFNLAEYPLSRQVLEHRTAAAMNVTDPHADPTEQRILGEHGDASLLMIPMLFKDEAIGTIELIDVRPRTYTQQEQRLARSMAALAAVALMNARDFKASSSGPTQREDSRLPLRALAAALPGALGRPDVQSLLHELARGVCESFRGVSCVASVEARHATAASPSAQFKEGPQAVLVGRDRAGRTDLTLTITLPGPVNPLVKDVLDLVAGAASATVARLQAGQTSADAP